MSNAVVVFSFPEPDNAIDFGQIVAKAKKEFADKPHIKIYAGINDVADRVTAIFAPLHDDVVDNVTPINNKEN